MWIEAGLSRRICAKLVHAVRKSSQCSYSTNIMSSTSASVNNQGSLWEKNEIKALIAVWGETGIQEEQGFEFSRLDSTNPDSNPVQCNLDSYM